jgi:sulfofructose kinase
VCVGLATLDAIVEVDRMPSFEERLVASAGTLAGGGVSATAAVTLARLGVPVAFAGSVGDDDAGRAIRAGLATEGVDVSLLRTVSGASPFTVVLVERGSGARALVPVTRPGMTIEADAALRTAVTCAEWVHVDHVGYAVVRKFRTAGMTTRISIDGGNPIADLSLEGISLFVPTEAQLALRYPSLNHEQAMAHALNEGAETVVVTRGRDGSAAAARTNDGVAFEYALAPRVDTVSTLGAGDVFHGALLAALVDARPLREALAFANAAAALSCRGLDGRSAIPSRAELDVFIAGKRVAAAR